MEELVYGDDVSMTRDATVSTMGYDNRRRPTSMATVREATGTGTMMDPTPLAAVTVPFSQQLTWDAADNLRAIADLRIGAEWPAGNRPQSTEVTLDALYRVAGADYEYTDEMGTLGPTDDADDWRDEAALSRSNDPMASEPPEMLGTLPPNRPINMTWEYDWLGNAQEWTDDAHQFYERSLGDITNGFDLDTPERPGSLRVASNLDPITSPHGGWLEVDYGEDGNVLSMTVHAECEDDTAEMQDCEDTFDGDVDTRLASLRDVCVCAQEQHYVYRWDEVNRLAEAMRFDRAGGPSMGSLEGWQLEVRQRYLYDAANDRIVKQTLDLDTTMLGEPETVALYVYPGDFERRGLVVDGDTYDALSGAETQYLVGGARVVWRDDDHEGTGIDRDQRITIGLTDLIQSTSATLDLVTGELVETNNYYANGARESYRGSTAGERVAPEPMGFTGKEADEEVGLTYFGHRYLLAHLGRWASPDPLQTHAVGGGEALNGYHYVAGSVLQARDPHGLDGDESTSIIQMPARDLGADPGLRGCSRGCGDRVGLGVVSSSGRRTRCECDGLRSEIAFEVLPLTVEKHAA